MNRAEVHQHLEELIPEEIPDNVVELIPVKNGVKKWAAENAYLLIYIAIVSNLGWIATFIYYQIVHAAS
jgi:hypothetical protein